MKRLFPLLIMMTLLAIACEKSANHQGPSLPAGWRSVIPTGIEIEKYPHAQEELKEHLSHCGLGVVKRSDQPNRCQYQITIDSLFLKDPKEKTGFIYDSQWVYQNGIQWEAPSAAEVAAVPEKFDLEDHGEMIRIVEQQCGDCWAQASRANLEQLLLTHNGERVPLSTQTLISSCCNTGTCGGGYMTTPGWIVEHGLPTLDRDPYQGRNSSCKFNLQSVKMDFKLIKAPYVGSSLNYSRAIRPEQRVGPKVAEIQALMERYKSSAVVTIQAISQSGGIIDRCSSINAYGNHMQDIVGWYRSGNDVIARVQNSWGREHGQNGYTHIKWECGVDQLNRGLGRSARVGIIKVPLSCKDLPDAFTGPDQVVSKGNGVYLGRIPKKHQNCKWVPEQGLDDPTSCRPKANPTVATEYHLTATTDCGESTAMVLVTPKERSLNETQPLLTPFGVVQWKKP